MVSRDLNLVGFSLRDVDMVFVNTGSVVVWQILGVTMER